MGAANFTLEKLIPETQAGVTGLQIMIFERMATHTKNWFKGVLQTAAFFGAYFLFAAVGSVVSVICIVPAVLFRGVRARAFGQKLIHALFRIFAGYLRASGLLELDADELSRLRDSNGVIVAANHPGLLDAVLMVSQMPRAVCLMKGSLARNIVLSGTARLAGYIHNKSGLGLVKKCEERLNEGANLLVFPEGTRTVGGKLLPFKMGFALAAVSTLSPVQTVIITADSNCLGKGWPLFKKPAFPVRYSLRLGERFQPEPGEDAKHFGGTVENYFQKTLSSPGEKTVSATRRK
ncbi:MAG: lysophospholipid acyltransferase family protein [Verrucomicrobiales bacterium]|nr:lysophospholipid acyltransferase family protein [Verrucomicrobiales bacterium]